jgi:tetratricopeptide (TPR) repeat protein
VDGRVEHGPFVSPYAYEWFIEGEVSAAKGQHDEAAMAFESATAAPASDVVLLARLAEEYELSGASRRADRTLSIARRANPDSARVALAEGRLHRKRGQQYEALAAFARARDLAPTWDAPVLAIAAALTATGHRRRAQAVLFNYLETNLEGYRSDTRRALVESTRRGGDPEMLEQALNLDPAASPAERARAAGTLALESGRPALAARLLEAGLDDRENVLLWLRALVQSGDRGRAIEFLTSPEGKRLGNPLEQVELLLAIGAINRAAPVLNATGPSPRAGYLRGAALVAGGDCVRATEILAGVPMGAASFEPSRLTFAECSASHGRRGAAAEALSLTPHGSLAVRRTLAEFYVKEGDLRAGLRLFDPKESSDRAALARIYEQAGQFDDAAAYYASLKALPTSEPRLRARVAAEQLASRDRHAAAVAVLERWTATAPDDLHARVRLVELLLADRQLEAAQQTGRETLQVVDDAVLRQRLRAILTDPSQ